MKKLINILIISTLILVSCSEDFLQLVPQSSFTSGNFYQTEEHFNQALIGTYAALRSAKGNWPSFVMGEMRSDNTHFDFNITNRPKQNEDMENSDYFLDESTSDVVESKYNNLYSAISRTNFILTKIVDADLEQQVADQIVGQAKFIRALCYFDLVRYFGGVPLYLEAVQGEDDAFIERSSAEKVYEAILADLEDAVQKLPVPSFPQNGRATKSSARMLLAHVYMTLQEYSLALNQLEEITTYGHDLLPEYASVFELANKNSIESIFEIQYQQGNQGHESSATWWFLPLSNDLSPIVGFASSNTLYGGYNMPTWEMINSYEDGDKRLDASIAIAEGEGAVPNLVIEAVKSPVGYTIPEGKRAYPYIKKFLHAHSKEFNTDDNFPIYRYSDVLLSLAEVLNELNRSEEALPYLNAVRNRADLESVTETGQAALRNIIAHERRVELAFENKRWLDLVRTGRAIEVMTQNGVYIKDYFKSKAYVPANSYNVTQDKLLFPIPYREIEIGRLGQNNGY